MNEREIFLAAIDMEDPAERAAWVAQACGSDAELRTQVEQLLKSHDQASQFLETPAGADSSAVNRTVLSDGFSAEDSAGKDRPSGETEFGRYLEPATRPGWLGRLAHYEIEEILGRGAFGIVAKAFDEKLHRVVAIKLMNSELASTSPPRKRFLREARTAAAVTHENIVAIHAVEEEPIPYLVMEYIPGRTLQQRMDDHGPLDVEEVLRIGQQVAAGLAAAHAVQLIHRDIKPSNILLSDGPGERAKISDFGLARAVDDASLTSSGLIAGTPMYMAPEQARGETLDHRADLFSLGSVLYQMASGRPPFRAANTVAVLKRVCDDTPRPLKDVIPGTPAWLQTIIFRLLEKDREDRYQTAQEVADLLARCQRELEHNGQVTCVEVSAGNATTQVFRPPTSTGSGPKNRPLGWLVGGVIVVAAVIGIVLMNGGQESADPDSVTASGTAAAGSTSGGTASSADASGWQVWPADAPPPAIAPFDAEQAKAHQLAWAKYLGVPVEYENGIGMKFRLIPPGEFLMGSTQEEIEAALKVAGEDEDWQEKINSQGPQHRVILTQPVYIGVTEVTQAQYEQVMGANPSHFSAAGEGQDVVAELETGNHPVEMVSWNDAAEFCAKLSQQEQLKPFYFRSGETVTPLDGTGYRLPTEAEWESACRAGTTTRFWSGDEDNDLVSAGWFSGNSGGRTHAVGGLKANPFGLSDVHGNVWEWVQDSWDPAFYGKFDENVAVNPSRPFHASSQRVLHGGSWYTDPSYCRSSCRYADPEDNQGVGKNGFRVVLEIDAVKYQLAGKAVKASTVEPTGWHGWPAEAPPPAIAPFDAGQAAAHQEAWAKYLGVPVEYENSIGMKFRLIPPGEFLMGSTPEEIEVLLEEALEATGDDENRRERINSEAPRHKVVLTQPVYAGVTAVTQTQYKQVMGTNPARSAASGKGETGNYPVEMVSWNDAAEFCAKLSQQEQLKSFYFRAGETVTPLKGTGYRLPTEAEWEYACRAGTTTRFWSGDEESDLAAVGWFFGNSGGRLHAAGELKANPFGLFDVHGNVWDWVQDGWDPAFYAKFTEGAAHDPSSRFRPGSRRVMRGGNWGNKPSSCRSSRRAYSHPSDRFNYVGFRVVLPVDAVKQHIADEAAASPDPEPTGWHGWPADAPLPAIAPFDAGQAKTHQEAWAKYLGVPVEYENSIGMKFRLMPPGEFLMGSTPEEIEAALKKAGENEAWQENIQSEGPRHKVILTQPVYVGVTEVTQTQYEQVMGANPSQFSATGKGKEAVANLETGNHPVEMVSWNDAAEFCAKLSQQEQLKPFYFRSGEAVIPLDGTGYRLPTEAEWESACRAGTTTRFWSGDEDRGLVSAGWFASNSGRRTHAAGELKANPFGLWDVHGNVWEWVQDSWDPAFYGKSGENVAANPSLPFCAGSHRVVRGGDWLRYPSYCRSSNRYVHRPTHRDAAIGFRVALPVEAEKQHIADEAAASPDPEPTTWHGWPAEAPPPAIVPFKGEQAKAHQEEWAKYLGVPMEYENSIGMKFRLIPPGEFTMGSTPAEIEIALKAAGDGNTMWQKWIQSESPQHRVTLTQPVYVGITEVTQSQYEQVMGINPSHFAPGGEGKELVAGLETENHPVEMVDWSDATEFCSKLSQQEQRKPFYFRTGHTVTPLPGSGYRLPTEAEWEFACRAGTLTRFWSGAENQDLISVGWFAGNSGGRTHATGELRANPYGLFDVHGNVREWVQDGWDPAFYGKFEGGNAIDPAAPFAAADEWVVRSGGLGSDPMNCRSSNRNAGTVTYRHSVVGFRVVLMVDSLRASGSKPAP